MKFRNLLAATAALTLAATPAIANAAPAVERAAAPVAGESDLGGESGFGSIFLGLLAVAAIIGAIVIASDGGNDDNPISA